MASRPCPSVICAGSGIKFKVLCCPQNVATLPTKSPSETSATLEIPLVSVILNLRRPPALLVLPSASTPFYSRCQLQFVSHLYKRQPADFELESISRPLGLPPKRPRLVRSSRNRASENSDFCHILPYSAMFWQKVAEFGAILYKKEGSKGARSQTSASGSAEKPLASLLD